jgi:hypothetical protein
MLMHQGHDATSLVERRIGKISFLFQGSQPLLDFQRFDAKCDSVPHRGSRRFRRTRSYPFMVAHLPG